MGFRKLLQFCVKPFGYHVVKKVEASFHSQHYMSHNMRRLEHLASLRIPTAGMHVLEVGAGIGDHSRYYIDRGNPILVTEAREENLEFLRKRYKAKWYPNVRIAALDLNAPDLEDGPFELIHSYGVLYHLQDPARALAFLSEKCSGLMFLETCVSFGDDEQVNLVAEPMDEPSQAVTGTGCRPTRPWVFNELKKHFEHVYVTRTQPNHAEFPIDWDQQSHDAPFTRAVFVASRTPLENDQLSPELINQQTRHP